MQASRGHTAASAGDAASEITLFMNVFTPLLRARPEVMELQKDKASLAPCSRGPGGQARVSFALGSPAPALESMLPMGLQPGLGSPSSPSSQTSSQHLTGPLPSGRGYLPSEDPSACH